MTPTSKKLPTDRPAELVAFFAIAPALYSWLVSVNCPNVLAIVLAFAAGVVPLILSTVKDMRAPGDTEAISPHLATAGLDPNHEQHGIDHNAERDAAGG